MRLRPSIGSAEALDVQLLRADHLEALRPNMFRWIQSVRRALGIGVVDLAKRVGVSQSAITQLEKREAKGTISITKLEAIAEALDCQFVYGFVPNRPFAGSATEFEGRQAAARKAKRKMPRAF